MWVPPKWAVLSVLSTKCWLSAQAIYNLLIGMSHPLCKSTIRRSLQRCVQFGLVERGNHFRSESGVAAIPGRHRYPKHSKWKLTERGWELINSRNGMKTKTPITDDLINGELSKATQWMTANEIAEIIRKSPSTVRKWLRHGAIAGPQSLNFSPTYKFEKNPDDRHGRRQWALAAADTKGWANAPVPTSSSKKQKKAASGSPAAATQHAMYGGLILMCSPLNKPTLIKAVGDLLVSEYVTSGKKFTAHDVTKRLRELVFEQVKKIDDECKATGNRISYVPLVASQETGVVHVKGLQVAKVEHEDVKNIVHDIFNAGGMVGIGRIHRGSFWEYDTQANIDTELAAQAPAPLPVATVISGNTGADPTPAPVAGSAYDGSSTI